jgi:hypothetical protein
MEWAVVVNGWKECCCCSGCCCSSSTHTHTYILHLHRLSLLLLLALHCCRCTLPTTSMNPSAIPDPPDGTYRTLCFPSCMGCPICLCAENCSDFKPLFVTSVCALVMARWSSSEQCGLTEAQHVTKRYDMTTDVLYLHMWHALYVLVSQCLEHSVCGLDLAATAGVGLRVCVLCIVHHRVVDRCGILCCVCGHLLHSADHCWGVLVVHQEDTSRQCS